MLWTTIGCPDPTGTPPTRAVTVDRRMVGGMGGNITSCMPDTPQQHPRRAAIAGVATYVPERVVTNAELARTLDTSDDWIVTRTGIRERHVGAPGETTSTMGAEAVRRLMARPRSRSRRRGRADRGDRHARTCSSPPPPA